MTAVVVDHLVREWTGTDMFSDITTAPVLAYGDTPEGYFSVEFDGTLTGEQIERVELRLTTATANEETIRLKAYNALQTNLTFKNTTGPQVVTGADAIINSATTSTVQKDLARGIKTLANFAMTLSEENNALIRLELNQMDAVN